MASVRGASSGSAGMLGERQRRGRKKRSWRDNVWGALGWTGDGIGWKEIVIKSSVCPSYLARLWDRPD